MHFIGEYRVLLSAIKEYVRSDTVMLKPQARFLFKTYSLNTFIKIFHVLVFVF